MGGEGGVRGGAWQWVGGGWVRVMLSDGSDQSIILCVVAVWHINYDGCLLSSYNNYVKSSKTGVTASFLYFQNP